MRAGGAPCSAVPGREPDTERARAQHGQAGGGVGGVGILISRSDGAVHVLSVTFLPALLHPRVPFLAVENLVSAGSLARCTQSVEVFAFALEVLAKYFVHKSCREKRRLVLLGSTAGSLSETLRLSSKSWNPERLCISRGQFIFSIAYLQFNYIPIQAVPLLKPKKREKSTLLQLFIFLFYLLLYIRASYALIHLL